MEGVVDDEKLRGMVPQAFYYTFAGVESQAKNMEFLVRGSFLEIYKDDVYDLLNTKMRAKMEVKESAEKGVFVKGQEKARLGTASGARVRKMSLLIAAPALR
jgi:GMP synthase PP-ATPase subunit